MKPSKITIIFLLILLATTLIFFCDKNSESVDHPSKITYNTLDWEIPLGSPYRTTLKNGLKLYIAEDHSLPLVTISGYIDNGSLYDPKGKEGLGNFAVHLMRTGGTEEYKADTLDAIIEHYAISISLSLSETQLSFKAKFLSQYTDTAMHIIDQILFHPVFEKDKIQKERSISIQSIEHRFDNPDPVLSAAYSKAMYPFSVNNRLTTAKSLKTLTRKDLISFHNSAIKTENFLLTVSGDIDKNDFSSRLEKLFPKSENSISTKVFPDIKVEPQIKFLIVHKKITQAYVRMGLPFIKRPHPDYYGISLFNQVLGSGGFSSRLVTSIRSNAGLTYSIYSRASTNYFYEPTFYINFFTKQATVNQAIALTLKEVNKLLKDGLTNDEFVNGKKKLIDALPSMFRSKDDIVDTYAWNEYSGRAENHYRTYPEKINALTNEELLKVANKHFDPDNFTYVIVGDTSALFSAEESDGFSLKNQTNIKIITQEMLNNEDLFLRPNEKK